LTKIVLDNSVIDDASRLTISRSINFIIEHGSDKEVTERCKQLREFRHDKSYYSLKGNNFTVPELGLIASCVYRYGESIKNITNNYSPPLNMTSSDGLKFIEMRMIEDDKKYIDGIIKVLHEKVVTAGSIEPTSKTTAASAKKELINDRYLPVRKALMSWYRQNAVERLGENGIGGGICDDGMCDLRQSVGNVYLRLTGYLCCENCTINFLNNPMTDWDKALADINSYFGPDVPQSVHQAVSLCRSTESYHPLHGIARPTLPRAIAAVPASRFSSEL